VLNSKIPSVRRPNKAVSAALLVLLLVVPELLAAGTPKGRNLEAINRQIWKPFIEGILTDTAEQYVGVHSGEFYWVAPGDQGRIMDLAEYDEDSRSVMKRRKEAGDRTVVELRFLERNVTDVFAAEKCIIKFVLHQPGKPAQTSYGITHNFSRIENGVWKRWLQYGSREPATEAIFSSAASIDDVARFLPSAK
jgi:hypothetical protein